MSNLDQSYYSCINFEFFFFGGGGGCSLEVLHENTLEKNHQEFWITKISLQSVNMVIIRGLKIWQNFEKKLICFLNISYFDNKIHFSLNIIVRTF